MSKKNKRNKKLKFDFDFHIYKGVSKSIFAIDFNRNYFTIELLGMELKIVWRFKKWLKKFWKNQLFLF